MLLILIANAAEDKSNESLASENSSLDKSNSAVNVNGELKADADFTEQGIGIDGKKDNEDDSISNKTKPAERMERGNAVTASFGVYLQITG